MPSLASLVRFTKFTLLALSDFNEVAPAVQLLENAAFSYTCINTCTEDFVSKLLLLISYINTVLNKHNASNNYAKHYRLSHKSLLTFQTKFRRNRTISYVMFEVFTGVTVRNAVFCDI
jgi:hypothetical protein